MIADPAAPRGGYLLSWRAPGAQPTDRTIHVRRFDLGLTPGSQATASTLQALGAPPRLAALAPAASWSPGGPQSHHRRPHRRFWAQRLDPALHGGGERPTSIAPEPPGDFLRECRSPTPTAAFAYVWSTGILLGNGFDGLSARRFDAAGSPAGDPVTFRQGLRRQSRGPRGPRAPLRRHLDPSGTREPGHPYIRTADLRRPSSIRPGSSGGDLPGQHHYRGLQVAARRRRLPRRHGRRLGEPLAARLDPPEPANATPGAGFGSSPSASRPRDCALASGQLCLGGRFRVAVQFTDPRSGALRAAQALPLTGDTGAFWFFDPANLELMVKVLDGRAVNGHFWVFSGALSDVAYTITVTDTVTGAEQGLPQRAAPARQPGGHRGFLTRSDGAHDEDDASLVLAVLCALLAPPAPSRPRAPPPAAGPNFQVNVVTQGSQSLPGRGPGHRRDSVVVWIDQGAAPAPSRPAASTPRELPAGGEIVVAPAGAVRLPAWR